MRGKLRGILFAGIFVFFMKFISAYEFGEENVGFFHLSLMIALIIVLVLAVFFGFKCWEISGSMKSGSNLKMMFLGLALIGIDEMIIVFSHFGFVDVSPLLGHFLNIFGFGIVGRSLYKISKEYS